MIRHVLRVNGAGVGLLNSRTSHRLQSNGRSQGAGARACLHRMGEPVGAFRKGSPGTRLMEKSLCKSNLIKIRSSLVKSRVRTGRRDAKSFVTLPHLHNLIHHRAAFSLSDQVASAGKSKQTNKRTTELRR